MRVKITDRCKVWEINDKDGMAEIKFSTSRKIKEDSNYDKTLAEHNIAKNGYVPTYYSFIRFIGHAYNKLNEIEIGDTITNLDATIEYEPYWDSNNQCVNYPKNPKITVFSFELYDENNNNNQQTRNLDKAPQVEESNATQQSTPIAPVQPIVEDEANNNSAADECPF